MVFLIPKYLIMDIMISTKLSAKRQDRPHSSGPGKGFQHEVLWRNFKASLLVRTMPLAAPLRPARHSPTAGPAGPRGTHDVISRYEGFLVLGIYIPIVLPDHGGILPLNESWACAQARDRRRASGDNPLLLCRSGIARGWRSPFWKESSRSNAASRGYFSRGGMQGRRSVGTCRSSQLVFRRIRFRGCSLLPWVRCPPVSHPPGRGGSMRAEEARLCLPLPPLPD